MNKWTGSGRLTKDPELKFTQSETAVCSFTVAIDRRFVNQSTGQREADFINVVAWRKTAEFVCKYFHKGDPIEVVGPLQNRTYQAQDGTNRHVTEVVADEVNFVVGTAKKQENTPGDKDAPPAPKGEDNGGFEEIDNPDDIPF